MRAHPSIFTEGLKPVQGAFAAITLSIMCFPTCRQRLQTWNHVLWRRLHTGLSLVILLTFPWYSTTWTTQILNAIAATLLLVEIVAAWARQTTVSDERRKGSDKTALERGVYYVVDGRPRRTVEMFETPRGEHRPHHTLEGPFGLHAGLLAGLLRKTRFAKRPLYLPGLHQHRVCIWADQSGYRRALDLRETLVGNDDHHDVRLHIITQGYTTAFLLQDQLDRHHGVHGAIQEESLDVQEVVRQQTNLGFNLAKGLNCPRTIWPQIGGSHGNLEWHTLHSEMMLPSQHWQKELGKLTPENGKLKSRLPLFFLCTPCDEISRPCITWLNDKSSTSSEFDASTVVTPTLRTPYRQGPISTQWDLTDVATNRYGIRDRLPRRFIVKRIKEIFTVLQKYDVQTSNEPFTNLEIWSMKENEYTIKYRYSPSYPALKPEIARKPKAVVLTTSNVIMIVEVEETIVKHKTLLQVFDEYTKDPPSHNRATDPLLRKYLSTILQDDAVRSGLTHVLRIELFQRSFKRDNLRVFAGMINKKLSLHLSNALGRLLQFWEGIPVSLGLVKFLHGRWPDEITDERFWGWIQRSDLSRLSGSDKDSLLQRIRQQENRIITVDILIAECKAFEYLFDLCNGASQALFREKAGEHLAVHSRAPETTIFRHIIPPQPRKGIWRISATKSTISARTSGRGKPVDILFDDFLVSFFGTAAASEDFDGADGGQSIDRALLSARENHPLHRDDTLNRKAAAILSNAAEPAIRLKQISRRGVPQRVFQDHRSSHQAAVEEGSIRVETSMAPNHADIHSQFLPQSIGMGGKGCRDKVEALERPGTEDTIPSVETRVDAVGWSSLSMAPVSRTRNAGGSRDGNGEDLLEQGRHFHTRKTEITTANVIADEYIAKCLPGTESQWDDDASTLCGAERRSSIYSEVKEQGAMTFTVVKLLWDEDRLFLIPEERFVSEGHANVLRQLAPWAVAGPAQGCGQAARASRMEKSRTGYEASFPTALEGKAVEDISRYKPDVKSTTKETARFEFPRGILSRKLTFSRARMTNPSLARHTSSRTAKRLPITVVQ
ncbi:MAG: hypothetical protein Q9210_003298 [Variospora velana]